METATEISTEGCHYVERVESDLRCVSIYLKPDARREHSLVSLNQGIFIATLSMSYAYPTSVAGDFSKLVSPVVTAHSERTGDEGNADLITLESEAVIVITDSYAMLYANSGDWQFREQIDPIATVSLS